MALVVETGAVVPGADSYVSLADARALAAGYGLALPVDNIAAEAALRNGAVYVGLQEPSMCGRRVSAWHTRAKAFHCTASHWPLMSSRRRLSTPRLSPPSSTVLAPTFAHRLTVA